MTNQLKLNAIHVGDSEAFCHTGGDCGNIYGTVDQTGRVAVKGFVCYCWRVWYYTCTIIDYCPSVMEIKRYKSPH